MKKKTILATILCALIMTGCAGGADVDFVSGEDDADYIVDAEENASFDVEEPSDEDVIPEEDDDTYDAEIQGGENFDGEYDEGELDDDMLEGQMLTAGNINELVGIWYEADVLDSRTLTIDANGNWTLEYRGGGALYGTVEITEEEMPDETINYWYTFLDEEGDVWDGVAVPDEGVQDDLYFGQGGEPHFVRAGGEG